LKAEEQDRLDREERRRAVDAAPAARADKDAEEEDEALEAEPEDDANDGGGAVRAGEPEDAAEGGSEPSAGPHDETETGEDPDGSGVVEHLLASGAEVDPKSAMGGSGE
jgi:hypothetical protein